MISRDEMEIVIHAFISARIEYCNSILSFSNGFADCLQLVQNASAKLLTRSPKFSHVTPILIFLQWLLVKYRIHNPHRTLRTLRSTDQGLLSIPKCNLKTKGARAFSLTETTLLKTFCFQLRSMDSDSTYY